MPQKQYLLFEKIPAPLKEKERILVANIDVSGIQSFIFGSKSIKDLEEDFFYKSRFVADLTQKICEKLQREFKDFILFSDIGGKILCGFKKVKNERKILLCLDLIQRDIFILTKGKLQIFYGVAECFVTQKNDASPTVLSTVSSLTAENKLCCKNILFADLSATPDSALLPQIEKKNGKATRGNFAAIKMDLDNLGAFFASVKEVDKKRRYGEILNEIVSGVTENAVYIGGDDIFAVVDCFNAIPKTAEIHTRLKAAIKEQLPEYYPKFGISAGVCGVGNSAAAVPPVFYLQKSEEYLEKAKSTANKNCVCIENSNYSWEDFLYLAVLYQKYRLQLEQRVGAEFLRKYYLSPALLKQDLLRFNREAARKGAAFLEREEEAYLGK